MNSAIASLLILAAAIQSDETKSAFTLFQEGSRLEGEQDYPKAIAKYRKALDKAVADKLNDIAAKSLAGIGRSNESLIPENMPEALAAYDRIAAEFADQQEIAAWAAERSKRKGVDVFVRH